MSGETETDDSKKELAAVAAKEPDASKPDMLRDNGPRIVGAIKIIPDIFLFSSGLRDTGKVFFRSAAAVGFTASRLLLLTYGSKNRKKDADQAESPYKDDHSFTGQIKHNLYKVTHPNQYPVESGAGVAALAGTAVALSGAAQMRSKATRKEGAIELGVGIFTALAEGNVLASKEVHTPPANGTATGEKKSVFQKLKDQPVLLSGITQAIASGSQIILGVMTLSRSKKEAVGGNNKSWHYLAAASIYTAADIVYAFFVRKNEFNTEAHSSASSDNVSLTDLPTPTDTLSKNAVSLKKEWRQSVLQPEEKEANLGLG